jgi:hypothetical protein
MGGDDDDEEISILFYFQLWKIDTKNNLLYIKGPVPGAPGSYIRSVCLLSFSGVSTARSLLLPLMHCSLQ